MSEIDVVYVMDWQLPSKHPGFKSRRISFFISPYVIYKSCVKRVWYVFVLRTARRRVTPIRADGRTTGYTTQCNMRWCAIQRTRLNELNEQVIPVIPPRHTTMRCDVFSFHEHAIYPSKLARCVPNAVASPPNAKPRSSAAGSDCRRHLVWHGVSTHATLYAPVVCDGHATALDSRQFALG